MTVIKTQESRVKTDLKHGPQDKPKQVRMLHQRIDNPRNYYFIVSLTQLFWEKRLQGLHACDMNEEEFQNLELPRNLKGIILLVPNSFFILLYNSNAFLQLLVPM